MVSKEGEDGYGWLAATELFLVLICGKVSETTSDTETTIYMEFVNRESQDFRREYNQI